MGRSSAWMRCWRGSDVEIRPVLRTAPDECRRYVGFCPRYTRPGRSGPPGSLRDQPDQPAAAQRSRRPALSAARRRLFAAHRASQRRPEDRAPPKRGALGALAYPGNRAPAVPGSGRGAAHDGLFRGGGGGDGCGIGPAAPGRPGADPGAGTGCPGRTAGDCLPAPGASARPGAGADRGGCSYCHQPGDAARRAAPARRRQPVRAAVWAGRLPPGAVGHPGAAPQRPAADRRRRRVSKNTHGSPVRSGRYGRPD